ncbi:MAG: V-type ATP synthase subunit I, partial [Acetanaerobacterium sp.]
LVEGLEEKTIEHSDVFLSDSVKFRFGRLPMKNYKRVKRSAGKTFLFYPLQSDKGYEWVVYITGKSVAKTVDRYFFGQNFERISVPRNIFMNPDGFQKRDGSDVHINRAKLLEDMDSFDRGVLDFTERKNDLSERIARNEQTLIQLGHIEGLSVPFDEIFSCQFIKIRFGRLPVDSYNKLTYYEDKPFVFYSFDNDEEYYWGVYFVPSQYAIECDSIFNSLYYERLYIPDSVHGTPDQSRAQITKALHEDRNELAEVLSETKATINRRKLYFYEMFAQVKFLSDSFEMRRYISVFDNTFHIVGFVPEKEAYAFKQSFDDLTGVTATVKPCDSDMRFAPPTKLKNSRFFKPFEMFVEMFGLPSYTDIDPTVFMGITYTLLFGMMFGDVGQGLCITLIGFIVWKTKRIMLGKIMERIGISSAIFGFIYGSVFGYEHLLDPFYKNVFGLNEKPIEVLAPDMTNFVLLGAVGIGVFIIITAIVINIVMGIKQKNPSRALLSQNGLAGFVLYCTVLVGAVLNMMFSINIFNPAVIIIGIVLPIALIFLRLPIAKRLKKNSSRVRAKRTKPEDDPVSVCRALRGEDINTPIRRLLDCTFLTARFGRLPREGYEKLRYYDERLFLFYITEQDDDYYWGIYFTPVTSVREADAVFTSLYFERLRLPTNLSDLSDESLSDIGRLMETGLAEAKKASAHAEKLKDNQEEGVGAFIIENLFELFEVALSYVTNTMSFLRVGGFILSHAGMMMVVLTLSEMVGTGASPFVMIIGNAFVMAMEGLIVGIQVLRLEFYEMFSRFFEGDGKPFAPITVGIISQEND